MSKNSMQQRWQQLKEWDRFMENEYPKYKERKKKRRKRPAEIPFVDDEDLDLSQYGI